MKTGFYEFKNKKSILILHLNYRNMDENYKKLEQFISNINYYLNLDYKIILIYPIPQFSENVSQILHKLYQKDKANFFQNIQFSLKNHIKLENYKQSK